MRALGGTLYLSGAILMVYNLHKTAHSGKLVPEEQTQAPPLIKETTKRKEHWHRWIESRPVQFFIIATIAVLIGGIVEIIPTFLVKSNVPSISSIKPYSPLELQGRDIYVREGCYTCHSQMIRPFRSEVERYGEYAKAGEFIYDHPFQWGSKRTGPDLQREGGKYPDAWHYNHMFEPVSMSPGSIMPPYPWLLEKTLDTLSTPAKIRAMQKLGVPYPEGYDKISNQKLTQQAEKILQNLQETGIKDMVRGDKIITLTADKEIIALIAYLQRLGIDIKGETE
jgi:cytochrome c oxidase cbb3-type subunit I/II